ncbi:SprT family zinc-dependent metalloprotease [Nitrososphaera sp.]|uniref:M48 family metallopeptidase n=1 Tax=Nitrososphaera sp. TaxID=1971748 RepID=UPI00307DC60D
MPLDDGRVVEIRVRQSSRARRLRLVSSIRGVEAVVPAGCDERRLHEFVRSRKEWIAKTAQYYAKIKERTGHEDGALYYLGAKYQYRLVKDRLPSATVSASLKTVTFHVTDRRSYRRHVLDWYRQQTGAIIASRLPAIAEKMGGLRYSRVAIKQQKSRWASCSRKKNLNFNLLLSAAPAEVIDYVIVHELAHIVELNHSRRFWDIVVMHDPDYKKHKQWLDDHSPVIGVQGL